MNTDRIHREFPSLPSNNRVPLPAKLFGWLALGVALFTLYGSYVPFQFHGRSLDDAFGAFRWTLETRTVVQSRSDFAANFVLGVPLGFCLLAWRLLDREHSLGAVFKWVCILWPWCVLFAMAVEFGQLYFPGRTCSGSDIIAQSLGAAIGMGVYAALGPYLIARARAIFYSDRYQSPAIGLLFVYLGVLAMVQLLPLDLSASPADWLRKYREGKVVISPFAELSGGLAVPLWRKATVWLELVGAYLPVGLLLAYLPFVKPVRQEGAPAWLLPVRMGIRVFLLGAALAAVFELCQILVLSRTTSVTDVLLGGTAVLLGWALARGMGVGGVGFGLDIEAVLILGQAWLLVLAVAAWLPFEFDGSIGKHRLSEVNWVPFASSIEKNYLSGLEEILTRTLLFLPIGIVVAAYGPASKPTLRSRILIAVGLAVAIGAILEAGQLFLLDRIASPTDLLLAGVGAGIGASVAQRLRYADGLWNREFQNRMPPITPPPVYRLSADDPIRIRMRDE